MLTLSIYLSICPYYHTVLPPLSPYLCHLGHERGGRATRMPGGRDIPSAAPKSTNFQKRARRERGRERDFFLRQVLGLWQPAGPDGQARAPAQPRAAGRQPAAPLSPENPGGLRVWGSGLRVWGLGVGVRVWGLGFRGLGGV